MLSLLLFFTHLVQFVCVSFKLVHLFTFFSLPTCSLFNILVLILSLALTQPVCGRCSWSHSARGPSSTVLMCSWMFHKNKSSSFPEVLQSLVGLKSFFFPFSLGVYGCTALPNTVFFCYSTYHASWVELSHKFCSLLLFKVAPKSTWPFLSLGRPPATENHWFNHHYLLHKGNLRLKQEKRRNGWSDHLDFVQKKLFFRCFMSIFNSLLWK